MKPLYVGKICSKFHVSLDDLLPNLLLLLLLFSELNKLSVGQQELGLLQRVMCCGKFVVIKPVTSWASCIKIYQIVFSCCQALARQHITLGDFVFV